MKCQHRTRSFIVFKNSNDRPKTLNFFKRYRRTCRDRLTDVYTSHRIDRYTCGSHNIIVLLRQIDKRYGSDNLGSVVLYYLIMLRALGYKFTCDFV